MYKVAAVVKGGNKFSCKDMQFRNTAGPQEKQVVALLVIADNVAFFNCQIDGYQDTFAIEYEMSSSIVSPSMAPSTSSSVMPLSSFRTVRYTRASLRDNNVWWLLGFGSNKESHIG